MDFESALTYLKSGSRIRRLGWESYERFIFIVPGSNFQVNRSPLLGILPEGTQVSYLTHIDIMYLNNTVGVYTFTTLDILSNDWEVVPNE